MDLDFGERRSPFARLCRIALLVSASSTSMCTPFKDDGALDAGGDLAAVEAGSPCDPGAPFGEPTLVQGLDVDMPTSVAGVRLSPDSLTAYFYASGRLDSIGYGDLYTATRSAPTAPFGAIAPLAGFGINTPDDEFDPTVTGDGLTLIFGRTKPATNPVYFYYATRATTTIPFTAPLSIADVLAGTAESTPFIRQDGKVLYFVFVSTVFPAMETDIYRATWNGSGIDAPVPVAALNTGYSEVAPVVTPDDLTIYFASDRTDGTWQGNYDVWTASRMDTAHPFSVPTTVTKVNTPYFDVPTFITSDGCDLYLSSTRNQRLSAWVATKRGQ
jgi:hypothetical protein